MREALAGLALGALASLPIIALGVTIAPAFGSDPNGGETVYACVRTNASIRVEKVGGVPAGCAASDVVISWPAHDVPRTTTTTTRPTTTTTAASSGTTTVPSAGGTCTAPTFTTSSPTGTINTDPGSTEFWWVNNDAWSGSRGPQTMNVCSESSWTVVSNQPDNCGGCVQTYPDTEYDVGGRVHGTTKPISAFTSITSTFAEAFPAVGNWDAGYDLWTNNWSHETMLWNQWNGAQSYWPNLARTSGVALTLDGVPYHFYANGSELMFFRDTQTASGSVNLLAALQWEVAHGRASANDVPTQLEYGVEIASTPGPVLFPMTGLTFALT